MGLFSRHSGKGHLRPVDLLCLRDVRRWRRKLEAASCGLPLKSIEHAGQLTIGVTGVLETGEVGETEA